MSETEDFFADAWLPKHPLCASEKAGPYRRLTRASALSYGYVEANPACIQSLIIADVDESDVRDLATILGFPAPSWTVMHPRPGITTGHMVYALRTPVCLTDAAHRRPVNLLARVETGVRDVVGGDVGYSGRVMKNPICPPQGQITLWDENLPTYGLRDLASALDALGALPPWDDPRPRQSSGVGRNVDIFERVRKWSYRAIKRYWSDGESVWGEVVEAYATHANLNLENEGRNPLPEREIYHLARSITRWTWSRFTPETFSALQSTRGKKGAESRWGQSRPVAMWEACND